VRKARSGSGPGALVLAACGSSGKGRVERRFEPGGSSGGNSDFSSLIAKTSKAKYKVTYQSGTDKPFTIRPGPAEVQLLER